MSILSGYLLLVLDTVYGCRVFWAPRLAGYHRYRSTGEGRASDPPLELSLMMSWSILQSSVRSAMIYLLQPRVLVSQFAQPLHLRWHQIGIIFLPVQINRPADLGLVAGLRNRRSVFSLVDDERLLCVRELRCFYAFSAPFPARVSSRKTLSQIGRVCGTHINRAG